MSTIGKAIKHYGLKGLLAYARVKTGSTEDLRLPLVRNTIRLRNNTDDVKLFKQLMFHREYEFRSPIDPKFIIDAGANIGLSALFFITSYPTAEIVAIEPELENFHLLCHNTRNYPNISCIHAGLWSNTTALKVTNPNAPEKIQAVSTEDVLALYNKSVIDLYKIDIEGAEKEIFSKNHQWLKKTKILIIELHDRKKQGCTRAFFDTLRHYNFECRPFGQNFLLINRDLIPGFSPQFC